jgi:hypothetical protein
MWVLINSFSAHALTIIPSFDFSVTSNPNAAAVIADVQTAINFYQSTFTAPITVKMSFSETLISNRFVATSAFPTYVSDYNTVYKPALLAADATSLIGRIASSNLPPVPQGTLIEYTSAAGRALGLNTSATFSDGFINLSPNNQYVIPPPGVPLNGFSGLQAIEHEMNEVLGIGGFSFKVPPANPIGSMNLFSQNVAGNFYLSVDGGRTLLAQFNAGLAPGFDTGDFTGCQVQGFNCFGQNVRLDASSPEVLSLIAIGYGIVSSVSAPEPSTGILLTSGLAGLAAWRLRRKH